jgi:peptide/nickel transport system substrate-binding protein
MKRSDTLRRLCTSLGVATALLAGLWQAPRIGLAQVGAEPPATPSTDLLKVAPFDRITLVDNTVVVIEPVSPRPLPPYDPKKERARQKAKDEKAKPRPEGNVFLPNQKNVPKPAEEKEEEVRSEIIIHSLHGDVRDFRVKRLDIKRVEYFEDMVMAEADRLMRRRDFARAFEHLLAVRQRDPRWPGLDDHVNRFLYEEGSAALIDSDDDRGLRLLGELHARKPDYPALADKLATAYGGRLNKAFDVGVYVRARQILHDLEQLTPDHAIVRDSKQRFIKKAQGLLDEGLKKTGGERVDMLSEALRIWPALPGAAAAYEEAFAALPTLTVAVWDLPRPVAPWVLSPATERVSRLLYLPVLAADSEAALQGNQSGQLAANVNKADLGRRFELKIRPGFTWSDGSRPVSAIDLVRALADRANPRCPGYNARWANLLQEIVAQDDSQVEVRLNRSFLRPETWLLGPIGPAHAAWDGWVTTPRGRLPVGDGPFEWQEGDSSAASYLARDTEGSAPALHVRRIREVRYPTPNQALAALLRGDVTMIEHVPPDRVPALSKMAEFQVGRYAHPMLHRIAIDGRNALLRNRTLRRGLSYAIDRKTLFEETLLRGPADDLNCLSNGPFPKGSYADPPGTKPLDYDPMLAKMLVAAARKEMGAGPIKLRFEYPSTPEARAVVPKIAEGWRKIDLEVETIERPESELEEALRSGRRFDLAYRSSRVIEPIWEAGPLLCPPYDAAPAASGLEAVASARILELLLRLERAPEVPSATGVVVTIARESHDELPVLPLWQLQDHFAWRKRLKGPSQESSLNLYQGIESWEIEPWFARDPW